jgi:acyl dehydratase
MLDHQKNPFAAMLSLDLDPDEVSVSDWVEVTQPMIDQFGACTLDPDPMHVDLEWAKAGPFGETIAFGFLTVGLLTRLMHAALKVPYIEDVTTTGYYLNYGFDRLRLIAPVRVNKRVRGKFNLKSRELDDKNRLLSTYYCVIEIEGEDKPALVADWLSIFVPPVKPA